MPPKTNRNLNKAKKIKFDEFFTPIDQIGDEIYYYREHFKDKVVYCNCDDPYESGFFKFFVLQFNILELKKLITTSYYNSPIIGSEFSLSKIKSLEGEDLSKPFGIKIEINEFKDFNNDRYKSLEDITYLFERDNNICSILRGDEKYPPGDFRSKECLKYLEEADIVVTNPPFSLFREYVDLLMKYNKKFLIIGNLNSVTYKNIFKYIVDKRLWLGLNKRKSLKFILSKKYYDDYDGKYEEDSEGNRLIKMGNSVWYTNLNYNYEIMKVNKLFEYMLVYKYDAEKYPKYDNFDAIEVSKVSMIPKDYYGVMGVPINYMLVHNPDLFEIVGMSCKNDFCLDGGLWLGGPKSTCYINGKALFMRIFIKRKI